MLNSAYDALRKFQTNFSEKNTTSEIKTLIQEKSCLDLSVFLEANRPISLCWDAKTDTFTGSQSFTIFPKLVINGELYEAPFKTDLVMPVNGFAGLECAFLQTLRDAIGSVQRVWN
jgi:hypothetical protein